MITNYILEKREEGYATARLCGIDIGNYTTHCKSGSWGDRSICRHDVDVVLRGRVDQNIERDCKFLRSSPSKEGVFLDLPIGSVGVAIYKVVNNVDCVSFLWWTICLRVGLNKAWICTGVRITALNLENVTELHWAILSCTVVTIWRTSEFVEMPPISRVSDRRVAKDFFIGNGDRANILEGEG